MIFFMPIRDKLPHFYFCLVRSFSDVLSFICLCFIIKTVSLYYLPSSAETFLTAASSTGEMFSSKGLSSSEASCLLMK